MQIHKEKTYGTGEADAIYKIDGKMVLVRRDLFEAYLRKQYRKTGRGSGLEDKDGSKGRSGGRRKGKHMYSLETANFAGYLKTLRKAKGMTQEKAAEELNIRVKRLL
jgi:hypothetical protein